MTVILLDLARFVCGSLRIRRLSVRRVDGTMQVSAPPEHLRFICDFIRVFADFRDNYHRVRNDDAFMRAFMSACKLCVAAVELFGIGENRCCSYAFRSTCSRKMSQKLEKIIAARSRRVSTCRAGSPGPSGLRNLTLLYHDFSRLYTLFQSPNNL